MHCLSSGDCLKRQIQYIIFALFAGFITFVTSQVVFRNAAITTDEHAYVMAATMYSEGILSRPLPPASDFFIHEMMIMDNNVGWLSRYPPGHALWLVPGVLLGQPRIMVSVAAGLSVYLAANLGLLVGISGLLLPLMLLASPFFILMNGTLLSHTSGLAATFLLLFCYVYSKEKKRPVFALFAGLAWSLLFINRTFTGLLIALPFAFDELWDLFRTRNRTTLFTTLLFVFGSLVGVFSYLYYNYLVLGDPFIPTYLYYAPSEKLGFGMRHLDVLPFRHTFALGLSNLQDNISLLNTWLFGFTGSLLAALVFILWGWHKRWSLLCLLVCICVPAGYIFFWFKGIITVGPVYYFELLPFLFLAVGFGIQRLLDTWPGKLAKVMVAIPLLISVYLGLHFTWKQGTALRSSQSIIGQYQQIVSHAPENSLILVEGFSGMRSVEKGTSFNPYGLKSDPLMVAAGKHHPKIILDLFPRRSHYHLFRQEDQLVLNPYINTEPVHYRYYITGTGATTGSNTTDSQGNGLRVARAAKDKAGWLVKGDKRLLSPGRYTLKVSVEDHTDPGNPVRLEIVSLAEMKVLATHDFTGTGGGNPVILQFSVSRITNVWPQMYYPGSGDIDVGDMDITEIVEP